MTDAPNTLDPLHLPLRGVRLIEASAGTGKTFTIVTLYLRLLLGLGENSSFFQPLRVEELLVLTFTEVGTLELRSRIRKNIRDLRIACIRQTTNNSLLKSLLREINDKQKAAYWLLLAEQKMDEAAIYTIHAFCLRMLSFNAFEAGMLYEQKLIEDDFKFRYQACLDFWRRYCYPLPKNIAQAVYEKFKGPEALFRTIDPYLQGDMPIIKSLLSSNETLESCYKKIISRIVELKKMWRHSAANIEEVINESDIDRSRFNRRNQREWLARVSSWAEEETQNHQFPSVLKKFSQSFLKEKTKPNGSFPKHFVFTAIDIFLANSTTLNDLLVIRAIAEIRKILSDEKQRHGVMGFNDLVSRLDQALDTDKRGDKLAAVIRARFPVVLIDEFQDTDPQQYRIFRRIWYQQPKTALLLIGDPKQAIYAFRGADIFTYMKARKEVEAHYTLDTNWRSSPGLVKSINMLFSRINTTFLLQEIPFFPTKSPKKNFTLRFEFQGKIQPAMCFWLMEGKKSSITDYQTFMAKQAAAQIRDWLYEGAHGKALLYCSEGSKPVQASDITVLVRNQQEAGVIRNALTHLSIPSVYLSNHDNVFKTLEAQDILWLLQAILFPERESTLRRALSSSLFGLTSFDIDFINKNRKVWDEVVDEFIIYREQWKKNGVMMMLYEFIKHRKIAENMLTIPGGERRLTDFLHICELLQEASCQLQSEFALIRWLSQHIVNPNNNHQTHQIRLESDKNFVQIVTIHKSKGLEYPLVWLPFIANSYSKNTGLYHDRISFEKMLDLTQALGSLKLSEAERLSEDLRLLYVALTRSIWHCSIGVAPLLFHQQLKRTGETDFHRSAIGYLIQKGEAKDATGLRLALENLCNEDISLCIPNLPKNDFPVQSRELTTTHSLVARKIRRRIVNDWRVISYSWLQHHKQSNSQDLLHNLGDIDFLGTEKTTEQSKLTQHEFPRGVSSGRFLHRLFENLDFIHPISSNWLVKTLKKDGYEKFWQPVLSEWITNILEAPLTENGVSLNQLSPKEKIVEMEFSLLVNGLLDSDLFDSIVRKHDQLSKMCPPLDFQKANGILRGIIDLVFRHNGRYYLLDYKTNWLGKNSEAYTSEAMVKEMCFHRYDLQYQLYTVALHRYLRNRVTNYRYETHFGGVIYLFLRGINKEDPRSGIFTIRPPEILVDSIDRLFSNK